MKKKHPGRLGFDQLSKGGSVLKSEDKSGVPQAKAKEGWKAGKVAPKKFTSVQSLMSFRKKKYGI